MLKVGDRVKVIADYSCFYGQVGIVVRLDNNYSVVCISFEEEDTVGYYFQQDEVCHD